MISSLQAEFDEARRVKRSKKSANNSLFCDRRPGHQCRQTYRIRNGSLSSWPDALQRPSSAAETFPSEEPTDAESPWDRSRISRNHHPGLQSHQFRVSLLVSVPFSNLLTEQSTSSFSAHPIFQVPRATSSWELFPKSLLEARNLHPWLRKLKMKNCQLLLLIVQYRSTGSSQTVVSILPTLKWWKY